MLWSYHIDLITKIIVVVVVVGGGGGGVFFSSGPLEGERF